MTPDDAVQLHQEIFSDEMKDAMKFFRTYAEGRSDDKTTFNLCATLTDDYNNAMTPAGIYLAMIQRSEDPAIVQALAGALDAAVDRTRGTLEEIENSAGEIFPLNAQVQAQAAISTMRQWHVLMRTHARDLQSGIESQHMIR